MEGQHLVLLFGESLLLDSVEANLAGIAPVSVVRLRTAAPEIAARIYALSPDLVIFDLDAANFHSLIPVLKMRPSVPLLGLDINCNRVVTLLPQQHTVLNIDDLCHIIAGQIDPTVHPGHLAIDDLITAPQSN